MSDNEVPLEEKLATHVCGCGTIDELLSEAAEIVSDDALHGNCVLWSDMLLLAVVFLRTQLRISGGGMKQRADKMTPEQACEFYNTRLDALQSAACVLANDKECMNHFITMLNAIGEAHNAQQRH